MSFSKCRIGFEKVNRRLLSVLVAITPLSGGCLGGAQVELSAADSIDALAGSLATSVEEYHGDVTQLDAERERWTVAALARRLRATEDDAEFDAHLQAFHEAMARLRADREVAWRRYAATRANLNELQSLATGLRELALDSMSLSDEARRYLGALTAQVADSQDNKEGSRP